MTHIAAVVFFAGLIAVFATILEKTFRESRAEILRALGYRAGDPVRRPVRQVGRVCA